MTDIKLPPIPVTASSYGMHGEYTKNQMVDYAREAVRLNAQAVPEPAYVELPDDIRVPLDSVFADAGYLIGRLLLGTMSAAQVIRVIQDRIEVAKAATRTALSAAPAAPQPAQPLDLGVMELAESVGLIGPASRADDLHEAIQRFHDLIVVNASIKAARHFADGLAQQDAKPIYQYQLATGGWIDQTRDSYEYNKANGVKGLRIVYEAAPQSAQQPLPDEQFQKIRRSLMQQSGWDGDGWDQALKEAIERAHGIGVKNV